MDARRPAADPLLADYALLAEGSARMLVRRGFEMHAPLLGLHGTPEATAGWAGGGRAPHPIVALADGGAAVVRAYRRGGAMRHLNRGRYFLGHRAFAELRAAETARRGGVLTPLPLAATERGAGLGYTAQFATLWLPDTRDLAGRLSDDSAGGAAEVLAEAGRQVGRMHAAGVAHPDLNLRNLLVRGAEVYLLDFDRARVYPGPVPGCQRERDLLRLARSARKLRAPMGRDGWAAFREGYGSGWPLREDLG